MAILVSLRHKTEYHFDRRVNLAPHIVRLRPAPHCRTPIISYSLKTTPEEHFLNWQQDAFGNYMARLVFPEKSDKLIVDVSLVAEMTAINPFDFFLESSAEEVPFRYGKDQLRELRPYLRCDKAEPAFKAFLDSIKMEGRTNDFLVTVNQLVQHTIGYTVRMEPGIQTPEETLTKATGSCRDSAWLLVQLFRHMGIAARFVSGYLVQLTPDQKSLDGPSGTDKDFTDLHAWTEVYLPGAGWVGMDPTSGLFAGEGHIPLAATPEPSSAAPISGATDKCEVEFKFLNDVTRLDEKPRTTKPYSQAQWEQILRSGTDIDQRLRDQKVQLTMGGEPTFISIDDFDAEEWNTAALGEHKRERAEELFRRLHDRFSKNGVMHYAQGKWYPGEPLPRWALNTYWRKDGEPIWGDMELLANPLQAGSADIQVAQRFTESLAETLGVNPEWTIPAYEDAMYYLWKEGTLPENVTAQDSRLKDPLERKRMRRIFDQGFEKPVGFTLPIARDNDNWLSGRWTFRREQMFLLPGDSPMGLRMPLQSLPYVKERLMPMEEDPFAQRGQLLRFSDFREPFDYRAQTDGMLSQMLGVQGQFLQPPELSDRASNDQKKNYLDFNVGTALCTEVRNGIVHVFFPPLSRLEDYLDLVASVEKTAEKLGTQVVIEGYTPPNDPRVEKLSVTPDPGVIEVNIHPSSSWKEMVDKTEILYEEARLSRLTTERFNLDGQHAGTGGGNHVTLGGPIPSASPMLRRPELLGSMIRYWQNHPSLSYLFSGQFIGPTSQSPRLDEARDETLYDLDIALQQLPKGESAQPWMVDRVLRNLLIDITGNTHRAEFCIDKLYSPDSSTGRLGILEFRGFEMPPHHQMSVVQQLLLRGLVAKFWDKPYEQQPVHWGTQLHDRWMLPHFVQSDVADIVSDLNHAGQHFDPSWFAPFMEFRFPRHGQVTLGDIELELRFAIEPWNVLGEEMSSQGTARYVDSSVERVQVKAQGIIPGRHVVLCNQRQVPLRNTGRRDEYVAGVRYKAWAPPSALHPSIGVQAPLVFDVVDTWNNRSLGGCTYHVSHPGGRSHETFPVNANEAEGRRRARFWQNGHTPGEIVVQPEKVHDDHPFTLDLRYRGPTPVSR